MKKNVLPEDSAKDIQLLFSRAGMTGAKYREFPRQEAGPTTAKSVSAEVGGPGLPAKAAARPLKKAADAGFAPPPNLSPLPFRGGAASSIAYPSLERIFSDRPVETAARLAPRLGVKLAILSLAGGVGKTTLAVTLARLLSGMRRQVLVADCGLYPSVAHHFGSRGQRLGPLQFVFAPSKAAPMPIGIFKMVPDDPEDADFQSLLDQVKGSEAVMLMDLPTLQAATPGKALTYADHILVPVTPDVHSVAGVTHLQEMLGAAAGTACNPEVHYLINRFDEARALHREVRARLQQLLGAKLLPFVIREDERIEEAAAHGMTVIDDSPGSAAVADFENLAAWFGALSDGRQEQGKEGPL